MPSDLQNYLNDTAALLHDNSFSFTSKAQLTRWVNEARRQAAYRTGCVKRLITGQSSFGGQAQAGSIVPGAMQPGALPGNAPNANLPAAFTASPTLQTIVNVERYPYRGFWNQYANQQHEGIKGLYDIDNLAVNWGGAVRPSLAWMPWSDLQAYGRAYATLITSFPYYWSIYNDGPQGEVWLFPSPSVTGDMEADAYCLPRDLQTNDDFDVIPEGISEAVKFLAASLAFMGSRRYMDGMVMDDKFNEYVGIGATARDSGKVSNFYYNAYG